MDVVGVAAAYFSFKIQTADKSKLNQNQNHESHSIMSMLELHVRYVVRFFFLIRSQSQFDM